MKTVAVVPARSGSKGFKNKNLAKIDSKTNMLITSHIGGLTVESMTKPVIVFQSHWLQYR